MVIRIEPAGEVRGEFEVEQELQRAFEALHGAQIRPLGGGRFLDGSYYVVLAHETDGPATLLALDKVGITASELKPRTKQETCESGGCAGNKPAHIVPKRLSY